jgi:uncharacterized phiE125 gp8 family phage protein
MNTVIKTAATKEPITLEEVKAMVGLETDQSQFDGLIRSLIAGAIDYFEEETNTVLMSQTWYGYIEDWPLEDDYIEIRKPPLKSITAIKYTTSAGGDPTEWPKGQYVIDINIEPGRVYLGYLKDYPSAVLAPTSNAIQIEFVCGYVKESDVPFNIKNALKQLIEYWFTERGADAGKVPESIMKQIAKHKVYYL